MPRSLLAEGNPLAVVERQQQILQPTGNFPPFTQTLRERGCGPLQASDIAVLQINVGKMCNQTCKHCHVDAGPDRTEIMTQQTMQQCLDVLGKYPIPVVDITGGAPEMNPNFRWLVQQIRSLGRHVMDRCNLTILTVPRNEDLPEFFKEHQIEVVASLPYFSASNTNRQRGDGVFERSIEALQMLNAVGYGMPDSELLLRLVYNPTGAFLPPDQREAEQLFRERLRSQYGIEFTSLYTVTNQPINRFLEYLLRSGNYEAYMQRLLDAFNAQSVDGLMCRTTISVGWDGYLYDCDFNQMLELRIGQKFGEHIADFDAERLKNRAIRTGLHCYACTAGQGSSCTGATVSKSK